MKAPADGATMALREEAKNDFRPDVEWRLQVSAQRRLSVAKGQRGERRAAKSEMLNAAAIRAWMQKTGIKGCSACGSENLTVSKDLYALVCISPRTGGPDSLRGSRVVRLRCGRCAHLMLFHARQMGLK